MDSKNVKIIAVVAVLIIVVAAAAVVIANNNNSNSGKSDTVTITQNDGTEVKVSVPVEKLCIVNTNAAEFATLLGVSDRVVGVSSTMIKTPTESWWSERENVGDYKTPDPGSILKTGATVVIGQCTSMPITNVQALQDQGVTVILLDMYGYSTQTDDLKQFAKLFPDSDASKIADKYATFFNGIVTKITSKTSAISEADKKTFLSTMGTKADSKYYSSTSELSLMLCDICGMKNVIADIVSTSTSSSVSVSEDPIAKYYSDKGIDVFILRNSSTYDKAAADIDAFRSTHSVIDGTGLFDTAKVIKTVDSKVLSGPRCFVGMVYFASTMNPSIDIGLTMDSVITDYNAQFGTSWTSSQLFYEYA